MLGLDPNDAKALVLKQKQGETMTKAAEPFQILPQKEWAESRKRLSETVNRAASILLNRLEVKRTSREIVNTGVHANNNYTAAVVLINQEIIKKHPKPRQEWTSEDFKQVTGEIDGLINSLTRTFRKKFYEEKKR